MMLTLYISIVAMALCALYTLWTLQRYIFRYSFVLQREIRDVLLDVCSAEYLRCITTAGKNTGEEECGKVARKAAALQLCIEQLRRGN